MRKKRTLSILVILSMLFSMIIGTQTVMAAEPFNQGSKYAKGAYDLNAVQPTAFNWTRQSRYTGCEDGSLKWSYATEGEIASSPVIGADGTIYVGSGDKKLYAINKDGSLKWSYAAGNKIASSAAIGEDGTIYVGSSDKKLYAINSDGSLKWSYVTGGITGSSPAIGTDSTIYVGSSDKKLYAINPDGSLKWSYATGDQVVSSPAIGVDGTIYVLPFDKKLYAINPDGSLKWSYDIEFMMSLSSLAIGAEGTIYVGSLGKFYAINPDGSLKWSYATEGVMFLSSIAIGADATIYVGSIDSHQVLNPDVGSWNGKLYAINPDGSLKWSYAMGSCIWSSPIIGAEGTIYVSSFDKKLYAINPDGNLKWSYATGGEIASSPAIGTDGTIYVGSVDKKLYAIYKAITLDTNSLTSGTVGVSYNSGGLSASGGTAPYIWSASKMPDGLNINASTGEISGTPTVTTTAAIYITVTDSDSVSASKDLSLTINPVGLAVDTSSLQSGTVGMSYNSGVLSASGGNTPYIWSASGLPNGLNIDTSTGAITGTPTVTTTAAIYITVTDSTNVSASKNLSLTIYPVSSGGGGSSAGTGQSPTVKPNVVVSVNGQEQAAVTETVKEENGIKKIQILIKTDSITKKIEEDIAKQLNLKPEDKKDLNNSIEVFVVNKDADKVTIVLTGDLVKKMSDNAYRLSIQSNNTNYIIPAKEIGIDKVAETLGVSKEALKDIQVEVEIDKADLAVVKQMTENAKAKNYEILFPPVEFKMVAKTTAGTSGKKEIDISKFSQYVERTVEIPAGIDASKITTGIVLNTDGTFSHIPTNVFENNAKYYAKLKSLTNSTYTVICNPIIVAAVENHWSKVSVNDMASRLVIKNPETFKPNSEITRGKFAEYITKALGLYRTGVVKNNQFKDVAVSDELADAIAIAANYSIISGYADGYFKSNAKISREEAMSMYARAMNIVGLKEADNNKITSYKDKEQVAEWAYDSVKKTVGVGVFNGRTKDTIEPKGTLTYAEAATAIRNLLLEADLINK